MCKLSTVKSRSYCMQHLNMILFYCYGLLFILITDGASAAAVTDTIFPNQTLKDGDTIVSASEIFELGFFSPGYSSLRYLGIWYNQKMITTPTVVWVANREVPLLNASSMLKLNNEGNLQLLSVSNTLVWLSLSSKLATNSSPVAQLLDSGNLVIRDDVSKDFIWQSFDHPGDTWLPGMRIGVYLVTGRNWSLRSWKTSDDPSLGSLTVSMNINGCPQLYTMEYPSNQYYRKQRIGYWNGRGFSGALSLTPNNLKTCDFVLTHKDIYTTLVTDTFVTRMILDPQGYLVQLVWNDITQSWRNYATAAQDFCERYSLCGVYGICRIDNSPLCTCLEGFEPKEPDQWSLADWSQGCKRRIYLTPEKGHSFEKVSNLKLPDSQNSWFNRSMSLEECKNICASNVSCIAFREGNSRCLTWSSDLIDIREAPDGDFSGQDIYLKIQDKKKKSHLKVTLPLVSVVVMLSFALILYLWRRKKKSNNKGTALINKDQKQDSDLQFFSLNEVVKATNNFSINNKLGQGGFGAVYKGALEGGEIAVKRLSKTSRQGVVEFQNEVICIAKLHHRNLVKLLGCCVQGEEMMLIYEYMPNKSLDSFLFGGMLINSFG